MNDKKSVYIAMRDRFGFRAQMNKAAEECGECGSAINKLLAWYEMPAEYRDPEAFAKLRKSVVKEIGDVYTTLEQVEILLDITVDELYQEEIENICHLKTLIDAPPSGMTN